MGYPGYPQRLTWVATPPDGVAPPPVRRRRAVPYQGPPAYSSVPRWGFPQLSWREPTSVPGTPQRVRRSARSVVRTARLASTVLLLVAIAAFVAAGGEVWRYTLLVIDRTQALPAQVVVVSDALVTTTAVLAGVAGVAALVLVLGWLSGVRELAARRAGVRPARPDWLVLLGVLLPVLNLVLAGSILAELEHAALDAPPGRPRPSRLVWCWWLSWVASEVLAITTVLLGLRSGVQALADGVLWYAATDLVAMVVALLTIRVIGSLTGLVAPATVREPRRMLVIRVDDAPAPPLRPARPAGATR